MSFRQRLGEAGSRAAGAGAAARDAVGSRLPSALDEATIQSWVAALPMPAAPATTTWTLSIGSLLQRSGSIPPLAAKALGFLDRFGRVSVGPESLGIDGDDIPWRSVTAVRTSAVSGLLGQRLVTEELDRVKKLVPPVPGRSLVLGQVGTVLGALLGRALSGGEAPRGHIVTAVESTGRLGRQRTTQLGLAGALVLMAMPDVDRSIRATAEQHGVPVMGLPTVGGEAPLTPAAFRKVVGDDLGGQGQSAGAGASS